MPVSVETVSIPLPDVEIQRPASRRGEYRVTFARYCGRGSTLAKATADLARQIQLATLSSTNDPAFARDDDGSLIVALDRPWGIDHYRITDAGHRLITTSAPNGQSSAEDLARCSHYTPVPPRR